MTLYNFPLLFKFVENISYIHMYLYTCIYSSPSLNRPLSPKATPLIRPDVRSTERVKYYQYVAIMRGHLSYKDMCSLQKAL